MVRYLNLGLTGWYIIIDVEVAPSTEAMVLRFRGGRREVVMDIRESVQPVVSPQWTCLCSVGDSYSVVSKVSPGPAGIFLESLPK